MTILVREGSINKHEWKHFVVIGDNKSSIVEMTPALFGWNMGKVTIQSGDDFWCGWKEASIVAFKLEGDPNARIARDDEMTPEFKAKLLATLG